MAITKKYYKGASACILAFSTTDRTSFDHIKMWKQQVENECEDIPMVFVQTKIDLIDQAVVTPAEVEKLANEIGLKLFRACSKDNIMV
jgi:Ras-related protein Rab-23